LKICITSSGENLGSPVNPRFGRCPYLLVVDTETKNVEAIANTGVQATRGAGIAAAQTIADAGCEVVISGNVGPNAFYALSQSGIKVFVGAFGKTCEEALRAYNDGELQEASVETARGGGFGRGLGRGLGGAGLGRGQGGAGFGRGHGGGRGGGGRR